MNYVLVDNGIVVQSDRTWEKDAPHPLGFIAAPDNVVPGFVYDDANFSAPAVPTVPAVAVVYSVTLWSRLTNSEAVRVESAMATQPVRIQNIFKAASSYRSDHELWPLLETMAIELFGPARAAEILAAEH